MASKDTISCDDAAKMLNKFDLSMNIRLSSSETARLADYFEDAAADSDESSDESSTSDNNECSVASDDSDMDDRSGNKKYNNYFACLFTLRTPVILCLTPRRTKSQSQKSPQTWKTLPFTLYILILALA